MNEELLPCPFCGSKQITVKTRKTTMVECADCGVVMFDYQDGVQRDVISAWNTRTYRGGENVSSEHSASKPADLPSDIHSESASIRRPPRKRP